MTLSECPYVLDYYPLDNKTSYYIFYRCHDKVCFHYSELYVYVIITTYYHMYALSQLLEY